MITRSKKRRADELLLLRNEKKPKKQKDKKAFENKKEIANDTCPIRQEPLSESKKIFTFQTSSGIRYGYDLDAIAEYLRSSKRPVDPLSREFYRADDLKRIDTLLAAQNPNSREKSVYSLITSDRKIGLDALESLFEKYYLNIEEKLIEKIEEWKAISRLRPEKAPSYLTLNVVGFLLTNLASMIQADKLRAIDFLKEKFVTNQEEWKHVDKGIREVTRILASNLLKSLEHYADMPKKGPDWLDYESRWYRVWFQTKYVDPKELPDVIEELMDEEKYIAFIINLQEEEIQF